MLAQSVLCVLGLAAGFFAGALAAGLLVWAYAAMTGQDGEQLLSTTTGDVLLTFMCLIGAVGGVAAALRWGAGRWQNRRRGNRGAAASSSAQEHEVAPVASAHADVGTTEASSARRRSAWPTVLITVTLSPLVGWIPALVQGRHARRNGADESYYWKAYAFSFLVTGSFILVVRATGGA